MRSHRSRAALAGSVVVFACWLLVGPRGGRTDVGAVPLRPGAGAGSRGPQAVEVAPSGDAADAPVASSPYAEAASRPSTVAAPVRLRFEDGWVPVGAGVWAEAVDGDGHYDAEFGREDVSVVAELDADGRAMFVLPSGTRFRVRLPEGPGYARFLSEPIPADGVERELVVPGTTVELSFVDVEGRPQAELEVSLFCDDVYACALSDASGTAVVRGLPRAPDLRIWLPLAGDGAHDFTPRTPSDAPPRPAYRIVRVDGGRREHVVADRCPPSTEWFVRAPSRVVVVVSRMPVACVVLDTVSGPPPAALGVRCEATFGGAGPTRLVNGEHFESFWSGARGRFVLLTDGYGLPADARPTSVRFLAVDAAGRTVAATEPVREASPYFFDGGILRLPPASFCAFRIVDDAGAAVAGATVMIWSCDENGRHTPPSPLDAVADTEGRVRLEDLGAGAEVRASRAGYRSAEARVAEGARAVGDGQTLVLTRAAALKFERLPEGVLVRLDALESLDVEDAVDMPSSPAGPGRSVVLRAYSGLPTTVPSGVPFRIAFFDAQGDYAGTETPALALGEERTIVLPAPPAGGARLFLRCVDRDGSPLVGLRFSDVRAATFAPTSLGAAVTNVEGVATFERLRPGELSLTSPEAAFDAFSVRVVAPETTTERRFEHLGRRSLVVRGDRPGLGYGDSDWLQVGIESRSVAESPPPVGSAEDVLAGLSVFSDLRRPADAFVRWGHYLYSAQFAVGQSRAEVRPHAVGAVRVRPPSHDASTWYEVSLRPADAATVERWRGQAEAPSWTFLAPCAAETASPLSWTAVVSGVYEATLTREEPGGARSFVRRVAVRAGETTDVDFR